MITVYNANNLAQQYFFQKAYLDLKVNELLPAEAQNPNNTFLSLEDYFANIGSLIALHSEYAMIPSDEEPFEINANTRKIKIPAAFNNGVAIRGDDMSEVITFTIDRYFDYVDLAGTKICVQWELPGIDGGTGISYITLVDLDTIPGKIRFGWPLTEKLTQHAGKVNFAVRFFIENKNQTEHDKSPYNYVLNTSPATITILSGLNIVDPTFSEANVDGEFKKFVENSHQPAFPKAESPKWNDSRDGSGAGKNLKLDSPAAIPLESDTLTLTAQATVSGNTFIDYKWYFKQGGRNSNYPAVPIETGDKFTVNNFDYRVVEIPKGGKRVINEQYFTKPDANVEVYQLYTKPTLLAEDGPFYERFTSLTINARTEDQMLDDEFTNVTGAYWVSAENCAGGQNYIEIQNQHNKPEYGTTMPTLNFSTPSNSDDCIIPTPAEVTLTKEPTKTTFTDEASQLEIEVSQDTDKAARSYAWYKNHIDSEIILDENIEKVSKVGEVKNLALSGEDIPGWYYVHVESKLNRAIERKDSSYAYRVVNPPIKPELVTEYCVWTSVYFSTDDSEIEAFLANTDNWKVVPKEGIAHSEFSKGDIIRLRVRPKLGDKAVADLYFNNELIENLYTDDITYDWYIVEADDPNVDNVEGNELGVKLTSDVIANYWDENENGFIKYLSPLNANYLDVWCTTNTSPITSYYCVVTNKLDTREAKFELEDYERIFEIW